MKKKVKNVEFTKDAYIPNKIRSHPFYFIGLPLSVLLFFIFFWIVLVPVLYYIFLMTVVGFEGLSIYFFLVMFAIFLLVMALFICQWRCKNSKETDVYTIEYEYSEMKEMMEIQKPTTFIDNQQQEDVVYRKKNVNEHQSKEIKKPRTFFDNQQHEDVVYEMKNVNEHQLKERPRHLIIEERPVSYNQASPLTPRELFFINMYEYSHQTLCIATRDFLQNERQFYSKSGPVYHIHSSRLSESQEPQYIQEDLYAQEERPFIQEFSQRNRPKYSKISEGSCVMRKPKETECFIANVVPKETCVSEAYLYVDEKKPDRASLTIIVDINDK